MSDMKYIGKSVPIRDAALKVTGQLRFGGDIRLPRMLYAKVLFSPVAHARIKRIDIRARQRRCPVCALWQPI